MRASDPSLFSAAADRRGFVYVQDIAAGIARALQATGLEPFTFCNLDGGSAVSITQLAEAMREFFPKWKAGFREAAAPPGDIVRSEAEIAAARRLLEYAPR